MRKIELTQGKVALVDDADYELVSQYKWSIGSAGYACRSYMIKRQVFNVLMHRLIMGNPEQPVDHINRDKLDNRRENLRIATHGINRQNVAEVANLTGFRGVSFHKGKYRVLIAHNKKRHYLGRFDDPVKAAEAYDRKALELYGTHAYLNFPITVAEVKKPMSP